jgi:apolipoprotein N-acyltransferase
MPLMVALSGWRGRPGVFPGVSTARGFLLGLMTGAVFFAGTLYWTGQTVSTFGDLPWIVGVIVTGILVFYQGTFIAVASAIGALLIRRFGARGVLLFPAVWVALEYGRGHFLWGGFPWVGLGSAVATLLPVVQIASLVGVYGVSLFLALLNACFAMAAMSAGKMRVATSIAAVLLVTGASVWGSARLAVSTLTREGTPLRIALVQGNVPQEEKWDPSRADAIVQRYLRLTSEALSQGAELVMWPESSTPFSFEDRPERASGIRAVVRGSGVPLLLGSDDIERASPDRYYNAAFMLDRAGSTAAVYRKMHLVPFGEYVPWKDLLFFVGPLVESVSDFSAGEQITMLPVGDRMITTAICFEVVFPELIRAGVLQGSELLTTITNDAWYGHSSAPHQHFELATMRAIEQGRYLARAANTGISGIVDPYGRVVTRSALFETTVVMGEVRLLRGLTVYARIGDLAPQAAVLITLLAIAAAFLPSRLGSRRV